MYYVIGSGPSGIAGASALIAAGRRVTMLDAGLTLDPESESRRLRMAACAPEDWTAQDTRASRAVLSPTGDLTAKLVHGSDYPYRPLSAGTIVDYGPLRARGSFAQGGLSNVWGAALLPFRAEDIRDWPVAPSELADAHAAVLRMLPVAGVRDDLERLFPLPTDTLHASKTSEQITRLLTDLQRHRKRLADRGIVFGRARLAVHFAGKNPQEPCNYCGHCMQGCPRDLIYSSRHTLAELMRSERFTYRPDVIVDRISEGNDHVNIHVSGPSGTMHFDGERAFLAAGVFHSTAVLLRSFDWIDRAVNIADSQYFVFPLLQAFAAPEVSRERLHTLAQAFIEISDETISPYLVHLQVYGFNDLLAEMLKIKLGALWRYFPQDALLGRLLLVQGFLHSAHSGRIRATLRRQGSHSRLELEGIVDPDSQERVTAVLRKLSRLAPTIRAVPISALLQVTEPGRSFHCGGSFPMSRDPQPGQTDTLGRPCGLTRTHVIDASIFPSIPATTMTQTVMANAFRIGTQAALLDPRERCE